MATANRMQQVERYHCGEIYLTSNYSMILECKSCDKPFGVYTEFLDHIFEKHFDDFMRGGTVAKEMKIPTNNENAAATTEMTCEELDTDAADAAAEYENEQYEIAHDNNEQEFLTEILEEMREGGVEVDLVEEDHSKLEATQPTVSTEPTDEVTAKINARPVRAIRTSKHTDNRVRKFKCKICGFAAMDLFNLHSHQQRHSTIRPYTCLKCDKAFFTRSELQTHIRRHNGEKPFICSYCGKGFVTAGTRTMHEKRHTGNRQYKCDLCDRSFFEMFHLQNHQVVHTRERKFECKVCPARFSRKSILRTHMKLHENALRYECQICQMRFNQRPTLLWHMRSKHNVVNGGANTTVPGPDDNEANGEDNYKLE